MLHSYLKSKINLIASDIRFREILTGSFWALLARIAAAGLSLLTMMITARQYGAEIVGILAVMSSFFLFTTIFTVLGTNTSILRLIPEYIAKYSMTTAYRLYYKVLSIVLTASILTTVIIFLFSDNIASVIFKKPHMSFYFSLSACFILFHSLMRFNTQAVRGMKMIMEYAVLQVLPALSNLLILTALTVCCFYRDNPIYAYLGSFTVTGMLGWIIIVHAFKQKIRPLDVIAHIEVRNIISISLPMLMTATMSFLIGQTGVLMLGMFRSEAEVGYYSIAVKLATLTAFSLQAINSMAAPKFSEYFYSGKIDDLFHVAEKSARLIFWTSFPVLLGLILFGKPILNKCFGQDFITAYPALLILISGQFIGSIAGSCGHFMNMTGHQLAFRNFVVITTVTNIALNVILIQKYGIIGAAITATICTAFLNISLLLFIKRKYGRTTGFMPFISKMRFYGSE
jgi:O-antigen/teichoic acid export membrane protein